MVKPTYADAKKRGYKHGHYHDDVPRRTRKGTEYTAHRLNGLTMDYSIRVGRVRVRWGNRGVHGWRRIDLVLPEKVYELPLNYYHDRRAPNPLDMPGMGRRFPGGPPDEQADHLHELLSLPTVVKGWFDTAVKVLAQNASEAEDALMGARERQEEGLHAIGAYRNMRDK